MRDAGSQLWLTSAITNDDVAKALTLCFSLKKRLSSRKIGVIVSKEVSSSFRKALRHGFDFVFNLEEDEKPTNLRMEEFVKLYGLTLKSFQKVVYLKPSMIVIKNSDEIFDIHKKSGFTWGEGGALSVLLMKPSLETFRILMKDLETRNGNEKNRLQKCLKTFAESQNEGGIGILPEKFNRLMSPQTEFVVGNESDISIIDLGDIPVNINEERFGSIAKLILKERKNIYFEVVRLLEESVEKVTDFPMLRDFPLMNNNPESIAIIGMSCRYPSANNLEEFWSLLLNGEDGTGAVPDFRWLRSHSTVNAPGCRKINAGFLKHPVDSFDSKFFGISPLEMELMDPQHRLLHELVWEALEDAAINPSSIKGTTTGVFIGSWLSDYRDIITRAGDANSEFFRKYMGNSIGAGAARISHLLGLTGPNIATESGCSSSMIGVHLACKSLQRRETNLALACGVNLLLRPYNKDFLPMVISSSGHCKTFDIKADGYARADGCGVLILKRVSDAVRDGDKIWAIIRGSGMAQEGLSTSLGTPTIHSESLAMTIALEDAGILPEQVSYVETHGTGTGVGDPLEVAAIAKSYYSQNRKEPLLIGSVKTNVGHTESCSGITGIMKVVLALQHEIIPPHINYDTLNPAVKLEAIPAKIPLKPVNWPRTKETRRFAGVSSFGITGTDSHVILEEPPTLPFKFNPLISSETFERPFHIMKISAKTNQALDLLLEKYKNHLAQSVCDFSDLAYTANIGRADFEKRAVILAKSNEEGIKNIVQNKILRGETAASGYLDCKICFLFTGQGSQYPGMAKQLYETSPVFQMHFEYCVNILKKNYNVDITQVLWSEDKSSTEINRTIYSQTSIFCVEYALLKLWESWGVKADFVLGHSLGEFCAAVCAGILSVEDAIKLVAERSKLIDKLPHGKMLVIKADKQEVDRVMKKYIANHKNKIILDYAAINSPEQTVLAGDSEVVLEFSEVCKNSGLKCIVLEATHAFHSKHMDPILNEYRKVTKTVKTMEGNSCKYISGMKGRLVKGEEIDGEYWVQHTREKVNFMAASKKAVELGCKIFIEIGPQPVLSALTMMNNEILEKEPQLLCVLPSLRKNQDNWETLLNTLAKLYLKGITIDWKGFEQFYERKKVSLPHYPFIGKKFWTEIEKIKSKIIHPLLGSFIPNPSSITLFQSTLNLKTLQYMKDHVIGSKIIFPGAGYLEMCLTAGYASLLHPSSSSSLHLQLPPNFPIVVENLVFQAPLQLTDSNSCQLHTIVEFPTVKIYQHLEESDCEKTANKNWMPHAEASFSIGTSHSSPPSFDADKIQEKLKNPSCHEKMSKMYETLISEGLKFGDIFKSLEKVWMDEEDKSLLFKVKAPPCEDDNKKYIVHPVFLDAMVQAILVLRHENNWINLCLPIKIGKFKWFCGTEDCDEIYIHAFNSKDEGTANLIDKQGKVLAQMCQMDFVYITVRGIESVLEEQRNTMPEMWEEVWKNEGGYSPLEYPANLEKEEASGKFYTEEFSNQIEREYNQLPRDEAELFKVTEKFVYLNILRAIYECGWRPEVGMIFEEETLFSKLKIAKCFKKYFNFMLNLLESEGIVEKVEKSELKTLRVCQDPPSLEEVMKTLKSSVFTSDLVGRFRSTLLLSKFGEKLSAILRGEENPLSILSPGKNQGYPSVGEFYADYGKVFKRGESTKEIFRKRFFQLQEKAKEKRFILRILEIRAGTGTYSEELLKSLDEFGIDFEYTFTDISQSFFPGAQNRFEKFGKGRIKFKKLNIEEDPLEQGFIPEQFDYVFGADVIHATKNLRESLRNMNVLMKPFAKLDMLEGIGVNNIFTFLFGTLDEYWRYEDFDLRPNHCTPSPEIWERVVNSSEFKVEGVFPVVNNHHVYICAKKLASHSLKQCAFTIVPKVRKIWLVFHEPSSSISTFLLRKISGLPRRKAIAVTGGADFEENRGGNARIIIRKSKEEDFIRLLKVIKNQDYKLEGVLYCWALDKKLVTQEEILHPYFNLVKALISSGLSERCKLIGVTNGGVVPNDATDFSHFHTSTLWGFTKSLKNENLDLDCRIIEVSTDSEVNEMENVFHEIWRQEEKMSTIVAFNGNTRYTPKLLPLKKSEISNNPLNLPKGTDRFQLILPATKSIKDLQFGPLEFLDLEDEQVEIQVRASALNFRDVLSVIKPSDDFKNISTVGYDISGIIKRKGNAVSRWQVGDSVFGCINNCIAMPSHIIRHQDVILPLPKHLNFCEGATIPGVYTTSILCLIEVAKIKKEDTVLIHTASGGVGLSAIQICKHIGCTIIATVGSKRKQNYLKSTLGIEHIFHSRNTEFSQQILQLTNGRGVDVVLNSLTSEGFKEATLKACGNGARFVEMSKMNIWREEEVKELRPDVKYAVVDIMKNTREDWVRLGKSIERLQKIGVVKPIPHVRFDALNVRQALEYMQKAKHIGKIVCRMPEFRKEGAEVKIITPMFNEESTYLITGGLGGIGFVVCQWMVEKGAKHVVLAGRRRPSETIQRRINEMNSNGVNIIPVQLDIGNFEQCKNLIEIQISKMKLPQLKGIMHSAGTLADGLIINQNWEKLSSTFNAKIDGTLNLHELTKNLDLEHFVLFSSATALFGSPGQSNYTAGNCFEDAFCQYRNSIGLPATTINWGVWAQVGMGTDVELPGFKAISNLQGLSGLEYVFRSHRTQTAIFSVSSFNTLSKLLPNLHTYLDERIWNKDVVSSDKPADMESSVFWKQYDVASATDKVNVLKAHIENILRSTLKMDKNDVVGDDADLQAMGVDSLMFVEIRNLLQTLLGSRLTLTANSIRDCNTISKISLRIVSLIEGTHINDIKGKPTMQEVEELMREDCKLAEHIRAQPNQMIGPVSNIKRVLLTGCTGTFGPYVLKILTNLPQITQVVCLMREVKQDTLEGRLEKILRSMELISQVNMTKVKFVAGDVAEPHLGMKSSVWEELSERMDAVFNCAASVQHIEYYIKRDGNQKDMRGVNIGGATNVLEFACEKKLKHVYHASSILAVSSLDDETGYISEKWPEVGDFDNFTKLGYPITKFVGDVLMKQGVERGIPCKVFRFPLMSGESETGRCPVDYNHILLMHIFMMKCGVMPSTPYFLPMLPVDVCAELGVKLFFEEDAPFELYNVIHSKPDLDQEFVSVAKEFGYTVNIVEFPEFSKRVTGFEGEDGKLSPLELFKELYQDDDTFMSITSRSPVLGLEGGGSKLGPKWWSKKLAKFVPNFLENQKRTMDYVREDLMFCKRQGWFEKFGL